MVARLGGDEFAVLVKGADDAGMDALADRALSLMRETVLDGAARLSASRPAPAGRWGARDERPPSSSSPQADVALRGAKLAGKDRWQRRGAAPARVGQPRSALAGPAAPVAHPHALVAARDAGRAEAPGAPP